MTESRATYEVRGAVALITMDAGDKFVTIGSQMRSAIRHALDRAEADAAVRAVVLTSAGKAFCVGNDLGSLDMVGMEYASLRSEVEDVFDFFALPMRMSKPVVAAVNGYALGGGLELVIACDMAVAAEQATFGAPEVKVGMVPAFALSWLPAVIGVGHCRELFFTGNDIDASTARTWGIVADVVPADALVDRALELASTIAERAPIALRAIKRELKRRIGSSEDPMLTVVSLFYTEDGKEGIRSFIEKRPPVFRGR